MRKVLLLLAVGCLLFSMLAPHARAEDETNYLDARFWLKATTRQTYTERIGLYSFEGNCRWQNDRTPSADSNLCITYTQWGSIYNDTISIGSGNRAPLSLDEGQHLLSSPGSRRLYIAQETTNGMVKLGYIENPAEEIVYSPELSAYKLKGNVSFTYNPAALKDIVFANNSHYILAKSLSGMTVRLSLTDFSLKVFVGREPGVSIPDTKLWAISNDGQLVVGSDYQNRMIAYELGHCESRFGLPGICDTNMISTAQEMVVESQHIHIDDRNNAVSLFSHTFGNGMSRISLSLNFDALNRLVRYVALGDSFSSGEGAWNYEQGTDGTDEFPDEKCHQSRNSYPVKYFYNHLRWSDEYYEPNLDGDMIMHINSFKNATCSGAETKHFQGFGAKYKTSQTIIDDYEGQFNQLDLRGHEEWDNFKKSAVQDVIPGRALQIDFLRTYKPAIATVGIGGNDIGFGTTLQACIVNPGTCAAASTNKNVQAKKIQDEFWRLSALFSELHNASPDTRLYAVGYPEIIANNDVYCGANVLLDAHEREFVKQGTRYLNQVIKAAAKKNGLIYINFEDVIGSAGLCGNGTWGVNGLSLGNDKGIAINNQKVFFIAQESYHPSYIGQEMMAEKLINEYGALDIYPNPNCPQVSSGYCRDDSVRPPAIPKYFGEWFPSATVLYKSGIETARKLLPLSLDQFRPGATIKLKVFSQETYLGEYRADQEGELSFNLQVPDYLEPGYHTLYASGLDNEGNELVYEQIFLYLSEDTELGPCSFLPYSNLDQDEDGIDDACDPEISVENPLVFSDPSEYLTYPNPERERPIMTHPQAPDGSTSLITSSISLGSDTAKSHFVLGSSSNNTDLFEESTSPISQAAVLTPSATESNSDSNMRDASSQNTSAIVFGAIGLLIAGCVLVWMRFGGKA